MQGLLRAAKLEVYCTVEVEGQLRRTASMAGGQSEKLVRSKELSGIDAYAFGLSETEEPPGLSMSYKGATCDSWKSMQQH